MLEQIRYTAVWNANWHNYPIQDVFCGPPPPNLTNALPLVYISFIWVYEYFLYQILSSHHYEQIYLKMTFSHVFKKKKKKKWLWNRKKETDISEVLLGDKKISKSGREKICFKDNNLKKNCTSDSFTKMSKN